MRSPSWPMMPADKPGEPRGSPPAVMPPGHARTARAGRDPKAPLGNNEHRSPSNAVENLMNTEQPDHIRRPASQCASRPDLPTAGRSTAAPLLPAQRDVLRQALSDAVFYRDPPLHCPACQTPDRLCRRCAADLSQARAYLTLSRELEISPAGPDGHLADPAHPATP